MVAIETEPSLLARRAKAGNRALVAWYADRARAYPWRRGVTDPYRVLVCEFMAQQTQASRVAEFFARWIERFPTVETLAAASRADVLRAWQGLGYNRRAAALHESARKIVEEMGGRVPSDVDVLLDLPGVGPYTAAAVAAIAFGVPIVALDTNIRRVTARFLRGAEPDELPLARLRADAQGWLDPRDPGAWNQAVMDVGAARCRPRAPRCGECPLSGWCAFRAAGQEGRSSARRQPPFEGSLRQVRGEVLRMLSEQSLTRAQLSSRLQEREPGRVVEATDALIRDGLLERTAAGRLRLASG